MKHRLIVISLAALVVVAAGLCIPLFNMAISSNITSPSPTHALYRPFQVNDCSRFCAVDGSPGSNVHDERTYIDGEDCWLSLLGRVRIWGHFSDVSASLKFHDPLLNDPLLGH
jgi:hypothetical protein